MKTPYEAPQITFSAINQEDIISTSAIELPFMPMGSRYTEDESEL